MPAKRRGARPCAPINSYSQALADPQVAHLGLVQEIDLPSGTRTRTVISPMRIDSEIMPVRRHPPAIGEHSDEILRELGLKGAAAAAE